MTSLMVLASIYLSVSSSLPSSPNIKPVEIWLLFNLAYPFLVIIVNVLLQVLIFIECYEVISIFSILKNPPIPPPVEEVRVGEGRERKEMLKSLYRKLILQC